MEKAKRKELEFQLRRREIIKQAERIFAAKGFYNTTMAEIADASGFAIGTLYQFFEGKEQLYSTMVNEKFDLMYAKMIAEVGKEETFAGRIEALVKVHFMFVENNVDFCNIFIRREGAALSEGRISLKEKMIDDHLRHVSYIEKIIREGIENGCLKVMESRMMASSLLGIIRAFIYEWMISNKETRLSDQVSSVLDVYMGGVKNK